jgi:hypothetical protein
MCIGPNGAAAGVAAQHSQCFGAWYSHCPGLKVSLLWNDGLFLELLQFKSLLHKLLLLTNKYPVFAL